MIALSVASNSKRKGTVRRRAASRTSSQRAKTRRQSGSRRRTVRRPTGRQLQSRFNPQRSMLEQSRKKFDAPLLLITIMLLIIGLIALLSASYPKGYYNSDIGPFYYFSRQLLFAGVGLAGMWIVSCVDYKCYRRWAFILYFVSLVLLVLVLTPLGTSLNNAQRWLFGFQPSEIAKLAIMLLFATMASTKPESVRSTRGLLVYIALVAVPIALLILEPHMSASMIIIVIAFTILFVAGMRIWFLGPVLVGGAVIAVAAYFTLNHVRERIDIFLNPFLDAKGTGWQSVQSHIAIGSGGLFGLGLGQSRQKFLYLPEPMNDFIFSVICEELGFIGAVLILILFAYFVYRGFSIARRAQDRFGCLLATGISMQFAFQILLNLAVVSGLFPVTGASLPLFSYGGTALVMQLVEIGILLNISRNIPPSRKE